MVISNSAKAELVMFWSISGKVTTVLAVLVLKLSSVGDDDGDVDGADVVGADDTEGAAEGDTDGRLVGLEEGTWEGLSEGKTDGEELGS